MIAIEGAESNKSNGRQQNTLKNDLAMEKEDYEWERLRKLDQGNKKRKEKEKKKRK